MGFPTMHFGAHVTDKPCPKRWSRLISASRPRLMFRFLPVFSCPLLSLTLVAAVTLAHAETPSPTPTASAPVTPESGHQFVPPKLRTRLPVPYPLLAHLNRTEGVVHALLFIY